MTSSPKRPWFRFHLLTAVLMMFAAGGLLWANTLIRPFPIDLGEGLTKHVAGQGWPQCYLQTNKGAEDLGCSIKVEEEGIVDYPPLLFDFLCGAIILMVIALTSESLLRGREGRKPSAPP
jgi:hypothetical protein